MAPPLKTHCKRGHEFTEDNTYRYERDGMAMRYCMACNRQRMREYRLRTGGKEKE